MSEVPSKYIDPATGRLRSYAEMNESRLRLEEAARRSRALHDAEVERNKTPLQKSIDLARGQLLQAKNNGDRRAKEQWQDRLDVLLDQQATEKAAADRKAAFQSDEGVSLIRDSASAIARSGEAILPGSDLIDRENLIAIATNAEMFPTPAAAVTEYWSLLGRIEAESLERLLAQAPEVGRTAADAALADSKLQLQIAQLELARAQRQSGGTDE